MALEAILVSGVGRRSANLSPKYIPEDPLLAAADAATELGIAMSTFKRDVKLGRFPSPYYITPRSPRWRRSELRAAVKINRDAVSAAKSS
jgi:predicted DNA-binding transcriptional regulator AlpA